MKKNHSKSSENDQLVRAFFFFRAFFSINRKTSLGKPTVCIFYNFPKNLDRTIIFNSVTLKYTQTEPQKYINFFNETNNIKSPRIK